MSKPRTQKGRGKIIFPPLQSNGLHHAAQVVSRLDHLGSCKCTLIFAQSDFLLRQTVFPLLSSV